LAKALSDFLELKSKGQLSRGIEMTQNRLQTELNIDIEKLSSSSKDELKNFTNKRQLKARHLEILCDFFKETGTATAQTNITKAKKYLEKSIEFLDIANEISKTISFERMNKKAEAEKALQSL
jgi:1-deoxy-D-xylulose 5-phosphate reductoisomerase